MPSLQRYRVSPPKPKQWTSAPFRGMYDSRANVQNPDEAALLINLMPTDPERGGALVLRPGLTRLTTPTTTQIAAAVGPQWMGGFTTTAGSQLIVIVAGGEIYTLSGSTLTKVVTTANLATAGITLSSTGAVDCVEFNMQLVVADTNSNAPFTWTGVSGAGGLTKLTNAPASRTGAPTIYYAKLFFIKNGSNTIVWSEENQPNTGYEAGGYNNAWALTQTSGEPVRQILGTNDGLYYFRRRSVGVIRGAVTSTFQTDGVHDAVTQQSGIGASNSAVPVWLANGVWWISADAHPMLYHGGRVVDIGRALPRRFGTVQGDLSPDAAVYGGIDEHLLFSVGPFNHITADRVNNRVHFEGYRSSLTRRYALICDADTGSPINYAAYPAANTPTIAQRYTTIQPFSSATPSTMLKYYGDASGYLFMEWVSAGGGIAVAAGGFDEVHNGAGSAVTGTLIGPMHGHTPNVEWQFTQIDVLADAQPNNSLSVGYITSRQHKASLTPADQAVTDTATNTPYERHKAFGINAGGRWIRPIISVAGEATANRLPQLHGYAVTGYPVSTTPNLT